MNTATFDPLRVSTDKINATDKTSGKVRRIVGNTLVYLGGIALTASAAAKFAQVPQVVEQLAAMGFNGDKLTLVAALELLSGILLLITRTRAIGLLMVAAYLGGAIATHVQHDQSPAGAAGLLISVCLGAALRHREALWSL